MTLAAVVLAAGKGVRFRSERAKVRHEVAGRSLLRWVLEAVRPLGCERVVVVVGHQAAEVAAEAEAAALPGLRVVVQDRQGGTGHAVRAAFDAGALDGVAAILVLSGDTPALTTDVLENLCTAHAGGRVAVATAILDDPTGYGRVVRDPSGEVTGVVEDRDATPEQRAVREVNAGLYCFPAGPLRAALAGLSTGNAQGEEYLTDVVAPLARERGITTVEAPAATLMGVNDRVQLAAAGAVVRARLLEQLMRDGVTVVDPVTTYVDAGVTVGPDTELLPGTLLAGATAIGRGATIGPRSRLTDTTVGDGATVAESVCTGAEIGPGATVGPFAHLRAGTRLGPRTKAGAYVEIKGADIGEGSKVPHLSYVGDATIGRGVNVGAGVITVNYDGFAKHRTTIGDGAFIGSDTMLVAPVTVEAGATTGAGSTITRDVPADALAVERADTRVIEGWSARRRAVHESTHREP